jgi:hypothetical protein
MRRILVLLSVVSLMVGMLAMSVAPAFAESLLTCYDPNTGVDRTVYASQAHMIKKAAGYTDCRG